MPSPSPAPHGGKRPTPRPYEPVSTGSLFERWDRYRYEGLLGSGGMGVVFKAFDPRLKRYVALKFLIYESQELQKRFMQEAQAQARVRHDHVCEIHEVGEASGHVYIAMQYIEGKPLSEFRDSLTLEQKIKIMKDVAEAVHEAHRVGLIHRDIKPANILVQNREAGIFHPYILDFGLVREMQSPGLTVSGAVIGTPSYMSPEQAHGDVRKLDRRSDVYSLGVTLYEFLCGHIPFEGTTGLDLILKIIEQEPTLPRKYNPDLPEDLQTIILKCLEKDPVRRYESAKAVADDLQRYLNGEPVQARPAGIGYRLQKRIQKHKVVIGLLAILVVTILSLGGITLQSRWSAMERANLAQQFGQRIEKMESIMRYAYLLPLHDIRTERKMVLSRIRETEVEMQRLGPDAQGPGELAMGRGYLSLHNYRKARIHLERAWNHEYRTPEVSYALGLALGMLYRSELESAQRISSKELREIRIREIEKEYRLPAIEHLRRSSAVQSESPQFMEGMISFYQKKYEDTLVQARQAFAQIPWLYEAKLLEGDVLTQMGNLRRDAGDAASSTAYYEEAEQAYTMALEKGSSDPAIYESLCGLYGEVMALHLYQTGTPVQNAYDKGAKRCAEAFVADPENEQAFSHQSLLHWRWGEYEMNHGGDPRATLTRSLESSTAALQLNPQNTDALLNRGFAYRIQGEYELDRGLDPDASLTKAIDSFQRILKINPNSTSAFMNMAAACWTKGEFLLSKGLDPTPLLQRAIDHYDSAIRITPNYAMAYANKAVMYWSLSEYELEHGLDPRPSVERALQTLQDSIRINPNLPLTQNTMGGVLLMRAQYEFLQGIDPAESLKHSIQSYENAIRMNPNYSIGRNNLAEAYDIGAVWEIERNRDPFSFLKRSQEELNFVLQEEPDYDEPLLNQANVFLHTAQWSAIQRESPISLLRDSRTFIQKALLVDPENAESFKILAETYLQELQWNLERNQNLAAAFGNGVNAVQKALVIQPEYPEAHMILAKLYATMFQKNKNEEYRTIALQSFAKASELNPNLKDLAEKEQHQWKIQ